MQINPEIQSHLTKIQEATVSDMSIHLQEVEERLRSAEIRAEEAEAELKRHRPLINFVKKIEGEEKPIQIQVEFDDTVHVARFMRVLNVLLGKKILRLTRCRNDHQKHQELAKMMIEYCSTVSFSQFQNSAIYGRLEDDAT